MVMSAATTVADYLASLPAERRAEIEPVLETVRRHLPEGYEEAMAYGMIGWGIPLSRYPKTYNKQPLAYVALAAQKNHNALYLMGAYADPRQSKRLERAFADAGKTMDCGKSCLRFKRAADLPLEAIGEILEATPPETMIALYEASRAK